MMDKTINPGLLFQRMYFESGYDDLLGFSEWKNKLGLDFEPEFSPEKDLLVSADTGKQQTPAQKYRAQRVRSHFSLRNHYLFNLSYSKPTASVASRKMQSIKLQTTYPGLLVGVGYNHQVSNTEAINAGFSFDHTTGLPLLPGSSVKGVLRSAFPGEDLRRWQEQLREMEKIVSYKELNESERSELLAKAGRRADWYKTSAAAKAKSIRVLLEAAGVHAPASRVETSETFDAANVTPPSSEAPGDEFGLPVGMPAGATKESFWDDFLARLEQELFASKVPDPRPNAKPGATANLPIPARVIFHAGEIVAANGPVLGPDNVTPHLSRRNNEGLDEDQIVPDRYVEPIPINLLKVMPGVTFAFRFTLPEHYDLLMRENLYRVRAALKPTETRMLFSGLLRQYGVGAKSRLGYGRLVVPATAAEREDLETTNNEFFPPYAKFGTPDFEVPPPERAEDQPAANADKTVNASADQANEAISEEPASPAPTDQPETPGLKENSEIIVSYLKKEGLYRFSYDGQEALIGTKASRHDWFPNPPEEGALYRATIYRMDGTLIGDIRLIGPAESL